MYGDIVIVHNLDLILAIETIHDALDINGLALIGIGSNDIAVIIGQNDGAHGDLDPITHTGEGHCTVGVVVVAAGCIYILNVQVLHLNGGAHCQFSILEVLGIECMD